MATHTGSFDSFNSDPDELLLTFGARGPHTSALITSIRTGSHYGGYPNTPTDVLLIPQYTPSPFTGFRRSPGDPGYGGLPLATLFGSVLKTIGMEWLAYEPGDYYMDDFSVLNPTTGSAVNANSIPLISVYRIDGETGVMSISGDMAPTVVNIEVGGYAVYGTIPITWKRGDMIGVHAEVTVAGRTEKVPVSTFVVGGIPGVGVCWPSPHVDGVLFPGSYYLDHFAVIRPDTMNVSDADVTPVLSVYRRNGTTGVRGYEDASWLAIVREDVGRYVVSGQIPSAYLAKDVLLVRVQVLIAGKTQQVPLSSFRLSGLPNSGVAWP